MAGKPWERDWSGAEPASAGIGGGTAPRPDLARPLAPAQISGAAAKPWERDWSGAAEAAPVAVPPPARAAGPTISATKASLWDRVKEVAADTFEHSPVGAVARWAGGLLPGSEDYVGGGANTQADLQARASTRVVQDERDRRAAYEGRTADDPWRRPGDPLGNAARFGADAIGMLGGSLPDPTNMIAPGTSLIGKMVGQAAVGAGVDALTQGAEMGQGVRDTFDPLQTGVSAAGGAAIVGAIEGAPALRAWWKSRGANLDHVPDEALVAGSLDGSIGDAALTPDQLQDILRGGGAAMEQFSTPELAAAAAERMQAARARGPLNIAPEELARHDALRSAIETGETSPAFAPQPPARVVPDDVPIIAAPEGAIRGDDPGAMAGVARKRAADGGVLDDAQRRVADDPVVASILDSNLSAQAKVATLWDRIGKVRENNAQQPGPELPDVPDTPKVAPWQESTPERARGAAAGGGGRAAFMDRVRTRESGGDDAARAKTSSATGRYQFTDATWLGTYRARFGETGETPQQILAKRGDGALQDRLMGDLTDGNAAALRKAGHADSAGNLYLAHFLGRKGGVDVLNADPRTPIEQIVGQQAVDANRSILAGKTAGDVVAWTNHRMGGPAPEAPWRMSAPDEAGEGFYSGRSQPNRGGTPMNPAEDLTSPTSPTIGQREAGFDQEAPTQTGGSDRLFRAVNDDPEGRPGFWEERARQQGDEARAQAQSDLEAEWTRREQARAEQAASAGPRMEQERTGSTDPSGLYGTRYEQRPHQADGVWQTTPEGFVAGRKGNPVAFRNPREAAKWAAANKMGGDFELASWGKIGGKDSARVVLRRRDGSTYGAPRETIAPAPAEPAAGRSSDPSQRALAGPRDIEPDRPGTVAEPGVVGGVRYTSGVASREGGADVTQAPVIRSAEHARLSRALAKQEFADVDFGRLSKVKLDRINQIRGDLGQDVLRGQRLVIPGNVVRKLYEKRVLTDGMKPGEVADVLTSVFHAAKSQATGAKHPHIQALINAREGLSHIGFIAENPKTGDTVVKSAYPLATDRLPSAVGQKAGGPRDNPPSATGGEAGGPRSTISDVRPSDANIATDAAARQPTPEDALSFLARKGGIRDDEGHNLRGGRNLQRPIPDAGSLIRTNGMSIDRAGELLHEAGYLRAADGDRPTTAEVLDLLDRAHTTKQYRPEDMGNVQAREEAEARTRSEAGARQRLADVAEERGMPLGEHETREMLDEVAKGRSADEAFDAYHERARADETSGGFHDAAGGARPREEAPEVQARIDAVPMDQKLDALQAISRGAKLDGGTLTVRWAKQTGHAMTDKDGRLVLTPMGRGALLRDGRAVGEEHANDFLRRLWGDETGALDITPLNDLLDRMAKGQLPQDIAALTRSIGRVFGEPKAAARAVRDKIGAAGSATLWSADSALRSMALRFEAPTIARVADMFHAPAGRADGIERTFHEAVDRGVRTRTQQVYDALRPHLKNEASIGRIRDLLATPNKAVRASADERAAAGAVRDVLKETLAYRRAAGEDIGEVSDGYFPRVLDADRVVKNQAGFQSKASRLYRNAGLSPAEADQAAAAWALRVLDQHAGLDGGLDHFGAGGRPNSSKAREFGKQADVLLRDFYQPDAFQTLASYVAGSVRRAEEARRFGPDGAVGSPERAAWEKAHGTKSQKQVMEDQLRDELRASGKDVEGVIERVGKIIDTNLGRLGPRSAQVIRAVSLAHAWNQLRVMDRATVTSLGDLAMGFVRGGPKYGVEHLLTSLHEFGRDVARRPASEARRYAEAIGTANDAFGSALLQARISAGTAGSATHTTVDRFYRGIGLQQLTDAGRIAATKTGQHFLRDLAHDLTDASARTRTRAAFYLSELGVKDAETFGANLRSTGAPAREDVLSDQPGFAADYATALLRYTNQSILMPTRAERPTWASHPVGGLFFALQSYSYGFKKNVLDRAARTAARGAKDRDPAMLAPAAGLLALAGLTYVNDTYLRPGLFGSNYDFEAETGGEAALRVADRAGAFGPASMVLNAVKGFKYRRSLTDSLSGSIIGPAAQGVRSLSGLAIGNDPDTNTAERAAAGDLYDLVLEPAMDFGATRYLAGPLRTAGIFATGNRADNGVVPADREGFVRRVAGEKEE